MKFRTLYTVMDLLLGLAVPGIRGTHKDLHVCKSQGGGVTCKSKSLKKQGLRLRFAVGTCKSGVELPSNDGSLSGERAAMEPH